VEESARVVAGHGLERRQGPGRVGVAAGDWQALEWRLWNEKLTGLAVAANEAGVLSPPPERVESFLDRHRSAMAWCLRVEDRLLGLDERFRRAGIEYAVLKGPAVAHTAYPDPSLRGFGDLDVLVRGRQFKGACAVLEEMGFRRRLGEPRPGFDERFGKAAAHRHGDDGMEIDLHRTLVLGPFGLWIDPESLLDRATTFELAGSRIPRLDDTDTLINVAMHAVLGWPPGLVPFRDVLQVSTSTNVDWAQLARRASEWRLSAVLKQAFATAATILGAEPLEDAAALARMQVGRSEIQALEAYADARLALGGTAVSTLRAIPGVRAKIAYVRAVAFPQQAFMRDRYRSGVNGTYRHRLAIPARWAVRRILRNRGTT
jgi:hypothetical protein